MKTMIKIALGIGLLLIVGYLALPQYHAPFASLAPLLLVLACPLAMYFGIRGMHEEKRKMPAPGDNH
jgi:hypothetical protein